MNIISERQEIAAVMNFGKYPVLGLNMSNTPLVHAGQIVAVAHYSRQFGEKFLRMMRVSKQINTQCMTVATLKDLSDEEMKEVRDFIEWRKRW